MANLNTARLKSQLLTSGLQQKDSALFQVINSLIGVVDTLGREISNIDTSGGGTGDTIITNVTSGIGPPGMQGEDGADGEVGPPGFGVQGEKGDTGAGGPAGPTTIGPMGIDGTDGDDGMPIPGPQGQQGVIGPIGPTGLQTIGPMGLDGEDGQDAYPIPGPPGADGAGSGGGWILIATQTAAGALQYDFTDLSAYTEIRVMIRSIVASAAGQAQVLVSTNNGSTFLNTLGDYINIATSGADTNSTNLRFVAANTAAGQTGQLTIFNFNMTTPKICLSHVDANFHMRFIPTTTALNAIRVNINNGGNVNSGTIYVFGR